MRKVAQVWNGQAEVDTLDDLVTSTYVGHIGMRDRDLTRLKEDIAAYRAASPGVRFQIEHQFGDGTYVASRVTAHAPAGGEGGRPTMAVGLNISRWEEGLLAEEWAVWETSAPPE
jgi:hypothetical protein